MREKPGTRRSHGDKVVKDIRRALCKQYSTEEKIRIVLDDLKGEDSVAEPCRRGGIAQSFYYSWSNELLEAGKRRLAGETARAAPHRPAPSIRQAQRAFAMMPQESPLICETRRSSPFSALQAFNAAH